MLLSFRITSSYRKTLRKLMLECYIFKEVKSPWGSVRAQTEN